MRISDWSSDVCSSDLAPPINTANPAPIPLPSYERQLSCQIWSVTGNLLGVSEGAPTQALSAGQPGFSEPVVDGVAWRVYTHVAPDTDRKSTRLNSSH